MCAHRSIGIHSRWAFPGVLVSCTLKVLIRYGIVLIYDKSIHEKNRKRNGFVSKLVILFVFRLEYQHCSLRRGALNCYGIFLERR